MDRAARVTSTGGDDGVGGDPLSRWSQRHGGLATDSTWVAGWARLTDAVARPLARHVPADLVTLGGVLVVALAVVVATVSPLLAAVLVVVGAVLDGVDGAVASLRGGGTPWGRVLDPTADRVCDLLLVLTLFVVGAPPWACVALALLTLLLEGTRASAQVAGLDGPGVVSVWERPSRVIVTVLGLLAVTIVPALLTWVVWAGVAVGAVGLLQLVVALRRQLA